MTQQPPRNPRRGGRKPKGNRVSVTVRLPVEVVARTDQLALETGVDRTAALTRALCERYGLTVPPYCRPPTGGDQQELPLDRVS